MVALSLLMEAVYLVKFELFAVNNSSAKIIIEKKRKSGQGGSDERNPNN